jgi:hypothetical protein
MHDDMMMRVKGIRREKCIIEIEDCLFLVDGFSFAKYSFKLLSKFEVLSCVKKLAVNDSDSYR